MQRREQGVALITTMLVLTIMALFIGAMLALNPAGFGQAGSVSDQAAAEMAIQAGLDYAKIRLQEDPAWRGNLDKVVVNTPTLFIQEDRGNVVGLMRRDTSEPYSLFRFRFNFHNGATTLDPLDDGLDDPSPTFQFPLEFVSINNLDGGPRFVPRPDSGYVVSDFTSGPFEVPGGSAVIAVEAMAGKGLAELSPSNLTPSANGRNVARRRAEVVLQTALSDPALDAAIMGGARLQFSLPPGSNEKVEIKSKEEIARARSKGDIVVNNGGAINYKSEGEVRYPTTNSLLANPDPTVTEANEGVSDPFYTLDWADIHQADPDPSTSDAIQINGGTYVWWDDDSLHYYDLSFDDYKTFISTAPNDPGTVLSNNLAEVRSATNLSNNPSGLDTSDGKFELSKDLRVVPSAGSVSDFTLIPRQGTQPNSVDTSDLTGVPSSKFGVDYLFSIEPGGSARQASFTVEGDVLVAAKLDAKDGGSMVVDGDLRLDAAKLEDYGSVGISLYSSGDIDVSTYHPESNDYGGVKIDGLYYAWGDLDMQAGEDAIDEFADLEVKGAMVAYGTDVEPSTGLPGTSGGALSLRGKKIKVEWDPKKLGDLLDSARLSALTELEIVSFVRH